MTVKPSSEFSQFSRASFEPPFGLRNPHVQTIFSSVGPRRTKARRSFYKHALLQQKIILECGEGVRLAGVLNLANPLQAADKMAVLIHGWEGSQDSSYMLSMASRLLDEGIDVFRLNMRDHGETHELNEGMFNSTLVDEVIGAIADLQVKHPRTQTHLIGFSLGGNFSLRVAALAEAHKVNLQSVIAFCPVVHAKGSNTVLNQPKNWVYGQYFVRKWKRSLRKKLQYFPDYGFADQLDSMKNLNQMNEHLVPQYTDFKNLNDYFDAYAIDGEALANTVCPCYLHFAQDDMIIPVDGANLLAANPNLHITITEHGGHCGFIKNWKFDSWQDDRALEIIQAY